MKRSEARIKVDKMLEKIGRLSERKKRLVDLAECEIERIKSQFQEIPELEYVIQALEKELMGMLKSQRKSLYNGADKVVLEHGIIYHAKDDKVTIPRGALELLKKLGLMEGVRVTEAVKREEIENWDDDKLALIGASRKPVNKYSYDVKVR